MPLSHGSERPKRTVRCRHQIRVHVAGERTDGRAGRRETDRIGGSIEQTCAAIGRVEREGVERYGAGEGSDAIGLLIPSASIAGKTGERIAVRSVSDLSPAPSLATPLRAMPSVSWRIILKFDKGGLH